MINVYYSAEQVADQGIQGFEGILKSPSARKPLELSEELKKFGFVNFVKPNPLSRDIIKEAHDASYVDNILDLKEENGFGNKSAEVANSLLYTNGAMYDAACNATENSPTAALVSGFHHAGYDRWKGLGYFCTFNGLAITALKFSKSGKKVVILDCDMHDGNGTSDILDRFEDENILHFSYGKKFKNRKQADVYLNSLKNETYEQIVSFNPDLIIYQAGADVHIDDPYGGVLTTEQIYQRDELVFHIAKDNQIPICWDLAGGYQVDENGSIKKVIDIHLNTFEACQKVYGF